MAIGELGVKARARLAFAVMAATTVFVAGPACAQEFVLKFATQTINDVQHEFIKIYKTELEKATNNRIRVNIYPASQLGGAQRQTEGLRLGTIEAATGPAELLRRRRSALPGSGDGRSIQRHRPRAACAARSAGAADHQRSRRFARRRVQRCLCL